MPRFTLRGRHVSAPRFASRLRLVRTGLVAVIVALMLGASLTSATAAQFDFDGEYILQCSCPVWWNSPWEGGGTFDAGDSLDTVALSNGGGVILMHEIRAEDGTLEDLIDQRTANLEDNREISDLEETWSDSSRDNISTGRTWTNAEGDLVYSFQYVQVWETNYLLSIEFVATEQDFENEWSALEDVLLVGAPVFSEFDVQDIAESIAGE